MNIYLYSLTKANSTSFSLVALRNVLVYRETTSNIEIIDFHDTSKGKSSNDTEI